MRLCLPIACCATILTAGCATTPPVAPTSPAISDNGADLQRVAAVNRAARGYGVEIHWINFPQRRPGTPVASSEPMVLPPMPDLTTGT